MNIQKSYRKLEDRAIDVSEKLEDWLLKRYRTIANIGLGITLVAGSFGFYHFAKSAYYNIEDVLRDNNPQEEVLSEEEQRERDEKKQRSLDYLVIGFGVAGSSLLLTQLVRGRVIMIAKERGEDPDSY